jgi:hypothetical protein
VELAVIILAIQYNYKKLEHHKQGETMSKVKEAEVVEEPKKLVWKEVRENLVTQREESLKQIDALTKSVLKIEGALEVGDQMHKEELDES